jgi:hypothetical protein
VRYVAIFFRKSKSILIKLAADQVIGGADPAVVVPAVIIPVVVVAVGLTVLLLWFRKRRRLQRVDDGTEMANKDKNVTVSVMNSISKSIITLNPSSFSQTN